MKSNSMQQKRLLALDFDGVIADSISECLVSGYNAYADHTKTNPIKRLEELDANLIAESKRIRRYIRTGEDYVFIFTGLHQQRSIRSQQDFDTFKDENRSLQSRFHDLFYSHREQFSRETPEAWVRLNPLFPGIKELLLTYNDKTHLTIVTTKQTCYVHMILEPNQIHLPPENVHQAAGDLTKSDILEQIMNEKRLGAEACHFVDDQVDTLLKVQPLGIHCYLAVWGYNDDSQAALAEKHGIENLELEDFLKRFACPPPNAGKAIPARSSSR
jgi:phosphoglycolate phosphatase-like HAD superfamily hydrolase